MKQQLKAVLIALIAGLFVLNLIYLTSIVWHMGAFGADKIYELVNGEAP